MVGVLKVLSWLAWCIVWLIFAGFIGIGASIMQVGSLALWVMATLILFVFLLSSMSVHKVIRDAANS